MEHGEPGKVPWLVAFMDWLAAITAAERRARVVSVDRAGVRRRQPAISRLSARAGARYAARRSTGRPGRHRGPGRDAERLLSALPLRHRIPHRTRFLSWAAIERVATNRPDRLPLRRGPRPDVDVRGGPRARRRHGGRTAGRRADELDGARHRDARRVGTRRRGLRNTWPTTSRPHTRSPTSSGRCSWCGFCRRLARD